MHCPTHRSLLTTFTLAIASPLAAQAPAARPDAPTNPAIVLSPFTVATERSEGYEATNTNSLIGTQTALKNVPITADVMNRQFFDDLALTNSADALRFYSAGIGPPLRGAGNAPGGEGSQLGDMYGVPNFTIRGFSGSNARADGVVTGEMLMFDQFAVDRTEVIRGPQTLLYGAGSPAGVMNFVAKQANFGSRTGQARLRLGERRSWRTELDLNQPLGSRTALRLAAVRDQTRHWRENLKDENSGLYGQLAFRPWSAVTLRLQGQHLFQHSVNADNTVLLNDPTNPGHNTYLHLLIADGRADNLLNGRLSWQNVDSFAGDWKTRDKTCDYLLASADVRIAPWLNARFSYADADWDDWNRAISNGSGLLPPTRTPLNPTGRWAVGYIPSYGVYGSRERSLRGQFVAEFPLWRGRIGNKFNLGLEDKSGTINFETARFYRVDGAGNFIVNPANANDAEAGRTGLPVQYYSVEGSLDGLPLVGREFVANGVTYRLAPRQLRGAVPATPTNPMGINGGANSGLNLTKSRARAAFAALYSDWFSGRFTTLAGLRYDHFEQDLLHAGTGIRTHARTWNIGAVYHIHKYVSPYIGVSSNYSPVSQFGSLLDGSPIRDGRGRGTEGGVKFDVARFNLSGSLAIFSVRSENEALGLTGAQTSAVDPSGINGRLRPIGIFVLRDREVKGYEVTLTARPTRNWRTRFSFSHLESVGFNGITLPQLYNDEFHTNAAGAVLFNDRSPVVVRSDPRNPDSAEVPLTVAMMRDRSSPYFTNLDPTSGRILNMAAGTLASLGLTNRADGRTIGTGRLGLPLAQHQLGFVSPLANGVAIQQPGETATGFPTNSFSTSAIYTFSRESRLRGVSLGPTLVGKTGVQGYYHNNASGQRVLKRFPDQLQVSFMAAYSKKFSRHTWSTQLNVSNLMDEISVIRLPDLGTGRLLDARRDASPRTYAWTNTLSF
jgi:outer membrane receptor protein involved in Fe transport